MNGLKLMATGYALPKTIVTNDDISKLVDTSDEWINERTGIRTRYYAKDESNVSLACEAAKLALDNSKIDASEIAFCIVATVSADNVMPNISCCVAKHLGLNDDTICFDLNAACSGFIYSLNAARGLLAQMPDKYALVIGSEVLSRIIDMTDRNTCVLFGDASGAAIVRLSDEHPFIFTGGCSPNDEIITCSAKNPMIRMDGQAVFRFAIEAVPRCIKALLKKASLRLEDIDYIVCHQANKRIIESAARRLNCDINKFFINLQHYGNTSSASIPLALHELNPKPNSRIICVGFGAGLTYGAALLTI